MERIKVFLQNHRNIIKITRYSLVSFLLLILTWVVDYRYSYAKGYFPSLLLLSKDVVAQFLSNLSGVFLTVTTFTFTTILTVLN